MRKIRRILVPQNGVKLSTVCSYLIFREVGWDLHRLANLELNARKGKRHEKTIP